MNEVVMNAIKEKPLQIPQVLFKNYKALKITEEELILLILLLNKGDKNIYDPVIFAEELSTDKFKIMQLLNDLSEKSIISVKVETDKHGKKEEYIYLDLLYNKLFNFLLDKALEIEQDNLANSDIFTLFEQELGRTISPMEVQIIREWLQDGISEELVREALKEAIYNDARSLKYIDRILFNWRSKGIKTKADIIRDKKNYRKNIKPTEPIYDYNWLEEE